MSRRFQFSLRGLLLVTGLVCCVLVIGPFMRGILREHEAETLRQRLNETEQLLDQIKVKDVTGDDSADSAVQYLLEVQHRDALRKRLREIEED